MLINKVKYCHKSELENLAEYLRSLAYPEREEGASVDPERIGTAMLLKQNFPFKGVIREDFPMNYGIKAFATRRSDGYLVVLNKSFWESADEETKNFCLAHELSHIALPEHRDVLEICDSREPEKSAQLSCFAETGLEWQANYLAGAILLPRNELVQAAKDFLDKLGIGGEISFTEKFISIGEDAVSYFITKLARKYLVSRYCIAVRLYYLEILNLNGRSYIRAQEGGSVMEGF